MSATSLIIGKLYDCINIKFSSGCLPPVYKVSLMFVAFR